MDKYSIIKCSLKNILKNEEDQIILFDAIIRTNEIVTQVYLFLRMYLLHCFESNRDLPILTKESIKMAMKVLMTQRGGRLPTGTNLVMYNKFQEFYNTHYTTLLPELLDGKNLSHILNYMSIDILTNIENNIKFNFVNNINRLVNVSFKPLFESLVSISQNGQRSALKASLKKQLGYIKKDVLTGSSSSIQNYHTWTSHFHSSIVGNLNIDADLDVSPQLFMKSMIKMNLEIERIGRRAPQFFPLRTSFIPKYIPIDTAILIDLFVTTNQLQFHSNIGLHKEQLWKTHFNMNCSIFKRTNWDFDHFITTDFFAVSLQFQNKKYTEQSALLKQYRNIARNKMLSETRNLTPEEKLEYKERKKNEKIDKKKQDNIDKKKYKEQCKEQFKKLSPEEQDTIRAQLKQQSEFPYIDEIPLKELEILKTGNWIVCDPGQKNLHYFRRQDGTILVYTNEELKSKTKRMKYRRLLENFKKRTDVIEMETELSNFNSRSCRLIKFLEYIQYRNNKRHEMSTLYHNVIYRKYHWYGYINKTRAMDLFLNSISKTFGENVTIFHGNWSMKSPPKGKSTPGISMKRKMAKRFRILNLDEYKTSKLNCHTLEENENLYIHSRKLHSVLTYKMENNRLGCIQRDANATINMVNIIKHYLSNSSFPEAFSRAQRV